MLREKEVENKDKKQNMFAALFVVIGFLSFSLWICDILLNKGQSRQLDLFSARMTDFLADLQILQAIVLSDRHTIILPMQAFGTSNILPLLIFFSGFFQNSVGKWSPIMQQTIF